MFSRRSHNEALSILRAFLGQPDSSPCLCLPITFSTERTPNFRATNAPGCLHEHRGKHGTYRRTVSILCKRPAEQRNGTAVSKTAWIRKSWCNKKVQHYNDFIVRNSKWIPRRRTQNRNYFIVL